MCVLVVEDELLIRMDLAITLEDAGHEVLCARDGPEALELAAGHPVPLSAVLTDFHMPGGLTGADVVAHFRTRYPDIPMFILTALTKAVATEFVQQHRVGIIAKPFDCFSLVSRVTKAVKGTH